MKLVLLLGSREHKHHMPNSLRNRVPDYIKLTEIGNLTNMLTIYQIKKTPCYVHSNDHSNIMIANRKTKIKLSCFQHWLLHVPCLLLQPLCGLLQALFRLLKSLCGIHHPPYGILEALCRLL